MTGESVSIAAGVVEQLTWSIPDTQGLPIHAVGLEIRGAADLLLESLTWSGAPTVTFRRPTTGSGSLWRQAWVDAVDHVQARSREAFLISQDEGRGVMAQGTGDWIDYTANAEITPYLARSAGIAVRVQGLKRFYALLLGSDQVARLVKMDDDEQVLAEVPFNWDLFSRYRISLTAEGDTLIGTINDAITLNATDPGSRLTWGSAGFVIEEGTLGSDAFSIAPA